MNDETQPLPAALQQKVSRLAASADDRQKRFMETMAARQREPKGGETSVDEVEAVFKDRKASVEFLKDLSDAGCGKFMIGRRDRPTRIEWVDFGAIAIAKAFLNPIAKDLLGDDDVSVPAGASGSLRSPADASFHNHHFLLRPDLMVYVQLPLNLTKDEANRLADFIRTLPF
jgi:hypothetical protein